MSVYDTVRGQAEHLCSLVESPVLRRADNEPMTASDRLELALASLYGIRSDWDRNVWGSLSDGEREVMSIAAMLMRIGVAVTGVDGGLQNAVGVALIQSGARIATSCSERDLVLIDQSEARIALDDELGF